MIFKHAVPILYSENVLKSLAHYVDVLGFDRQWDWGDPPSFGGVIKDSVEIFFCENCQGNKGTWICLLVDDLDGYYESIRGKSANIISAPENKEWGMREMLVQDPDGHMIRFGQTSTVSDRLVVSGSLPPEIKILAKYPEVEDTRKLEIAMGWTPSANNNNYSKSSTVFSVVAENTISGELVGCAFVLGDRNNFFYIRNVWVHPEWRNKHVGTALMRAVTDWLEENASPDSSAWLHSDEKLATFYRQFGFSPVFGMYREIGIKKQE